MSTNTNRAMPKNKNLLGIYCNVLLLVIVQQSGKKQFFIGFNWMYICAAVGTNRRRYGLIIGYNCSSTVWLQRWNDWSSLDSQKSLTLKSLVASTSAPTSQPATHLHLYWYLMRDRWRVNKSILISMVGKHVLRIKLTTCRTASSKRIERRHRKQIKYQNHSNLFTNRCSSTRII